MEVSARNNFAGTIKKLQQGPINTEVILEIATRCRNNSNYH